MAGEAFRYTPPEYTSAKRHVVESKYGKYQTSKGVIVTSPGVRETTADLGVRATEKVTIPLGFVVAIAAVPFAPIVSAAALAGVGTDYMGKELAREEAKKRKKKRMEEAKKRAANEGKVVIDNSELSAEMQRRKKIEMNLRAKQGTVYSKDQVKLAA